MLYRMTDAFSDAFSMFMLIEYNQDDKPIIITSDVKEIELYKELYLKYFNSNYFKKSKIKQKPKDFSEKCITVHKNPIFDMTHLFKEYVRDKSIFESKEHYCYSLVSYRNTHKGMDDKMMEYIRAIFKDGIDLGNSRNFVSFEEMEQRFLTLCSSKFYVGSEVSWSIFCQFFHKHCMHMFQLSPYFSTQEIKLNDLILRVNPHTVMEKNL